MRALKVGHELALITHEINEGYCSSPALARILPLQWQKGLACSSRCAGPFLAHNMQPCCAPRIAAQHAMLAQKQAHARLQKPYVMISPLRRPLWPADVMSDVANCSSTECANSRERFHHIAMLPVPIPSGIGFPDLPPTCRFAADAGHGRGVRSTGRRWQWLWVDTAADYAAPGFFSNTWFSRG